METCVYWQYLNTWHDDRTLFSVRQQRPISRLLLFPTLPASIPAHRSTYQPEGQSKLTIWHCFSNGRRTSMTRIDGWTRNAFDSGFVELFREGTRGWRGRNFGGRKRFGGDLGDITVPSWEGVRRIGSRLWNKMTKRSLWLWYQKMKNRRFKWIKGDYRT